VESNYLFFPNGENLLLVFRCPGGIGGKSIGREIREKGVQSINEKAVEAVCQWQWHWPFQLPTGPFLGPNTESRLLQLRGKWAAATACGEEAMGNPKI
jgi:hypothetical protein